MSRPWARVPLVLALVACLVVPSPAMATHDLPFPPPDPAPGHDTVLIQALDEMNKTIAAAQSEIGATNQDLQGAKREWNNAVVFFRSGDLHTSVERMLLAAPLINKAVWEHKSSTSTDPDNAFAAQSLAAERDARNQIAFTHQQFMGIQETGVDLFILDYAILAGDLLAQGERLLVNYGEFRQAWDRGERSTDIRNGLVAFPSGAFLLGDLAQRILAYGVSTAPDRPVGPIVGNHTLATIIGTWGPKINGMSRSVDRYLPGIVNEDIQRHRNLAALGALTMWVRQQPFADAQRKNQGDPPLDARAAFGTLEAALLAEDSNLITDRWSELDRASNNAFLRGALQIYSSLAHRIDNATESASQNTAMASRAGEALGWIASARFGASFMLQAVGEDPLDPIVYWPAESDVGPPVDRPTDGGGGGSGAWLIGAAIVVVVVGVGVLVARRVGAKPPSQ